MRAAAGLLIALALAGCAVAPETDDGRLRIMSLDGCADQYVLAMAPDADLALSPRADDADSYMRDAAEGRRRVRPGLEAAVGFRPDVVVRQWGGDARLLAALKARGVKVVEIGDASNLTAVRAQVTRVAAQLGRPEAGARLTAEMDARLAAAAKARSGQGEAALYLTAAGWTTGPGGLIDAVMAEAGLRNAEPDAGFRALDLEALALDPPKRFVLSFFDRPGADRHGVGRHEIVRQAVARGQARRVPDALLSCPAWFAAEAVEGLAR